MLPGSRASRCDAAAQSAAGQASDTTVGLERDQKGQHVGTYCIRSDVATSEADKAELLE